MSVPVERLQTQLERLAERGYRTTTFTESVLRPRRGRWLVVTFDDGFRDVRRTAFPLLQQLGMVASVFLPSAYIGTAGPLTWPEFDPSPEPRGEALEPLLWSEVAELAAAGWEVGSHSRTHPRLPMLDDRCLAEELGGSREEIRSRLGEPVTSLAYPFGDVDQRVVDAARSAGYVTAAATATALQRGGTLEVPRVSIYCGDGERRFALKTSRPLQSRPVSALLQVGRALGRHALPARRATKQ